MSREDSQFKLRMPAELREKIEEAAKDSKRSLNAEIVANLELAVLKQNLGSEFLPASKAREMSVAFRKSIPTEIKSRAIESINYAVVHGLTTARVELQDMGLELLSDNDAESLTDLISKSLSDAGYEIEWDGLTSLWIDFC